MLFVVALAIVPVVQASPRPDGGPTYEPALASNPRVSANSDAISKTPMITIHSTDNVKRGQTGTFVLTMKPGRFLGGMYVKFSVSGTADQGADYVVPVSPAYIGRSGYAVIQVKTLPDVRESPTFEALSVVITLVDGEGYRVGGDSSATMWIKP